MPIELTVNLPKKILSIDGRSITLEASLLDAETESEGSERYLSLAYSPTIKEDDSPVYRDLDKLESIYGAEYLEKINAGGSFLEDTHYLTFSGNINPRVELE